MRIERLRKLKSGRTKLAMSLIGFMLFVFFIFISSALIEEKHYSLGQDVKIDLSSYENYELIIKTPSRTLMKEGNKDVFLFNLDEVGKYEFDLNYGGGVENYQLEVQLESNNSSPLFEGVFVGAVNSTEEINNLNARFEENNFSFISSQEVNGFYLEKVIRVGEKPVWKKLVSGGEDGLELDLPKMADNISLKSRGKPVDFEVSESFFVAAKNLISENPKKSFLTDSTEENLILQYETPAPQKIEKKIKENMKEVIVSSDFHYQNVLVNTILDFPISESKKDYVRIYWVENDSWIIPRVLDKDNDGVYEYIEWIAPHLSTQTFEVIIEITDAIHLSENKSFIENIYENVKAQDGNWSLIEKGDWVRVAFEKNLTSENDITIYAKSNDSAYIEVYGSESNVLLTTFFEVFEEGFYKVFLSNLTESFNVFDLRILGAPVLFDLIIDPSFTQDYFTGFEAGVSGWTFGGSDGARNTDRSYCTDSVCSSGGSYSANVKDNSATSYIQQTFDLSDICKGSSCDYINLSFWVFYESVIDAGEELDVKCDGTTIWSCYPQSGDNPADDSVQCSGDMENAWHYHTINLSNPEFGSCTIDNSVTLRFESEFSGNNEECWIDGINITGYGNVAPSPSPEINSSYGDNSSSENLYCFDILEDLDGDEMNATVRWYNDGGLNLTLNYENDYSNGSNFNSVLLSGNISLHQNWSCSLQLTDGSKTSSWVNSSKLMIIPPLPSLNFTIISPLKKKYASQTIDFNLSLNRPGSECNYSLDSGVNRTMSALNSTYFYGTSVLSDGEHNVNFYCFTASNDFYTDEVDFLVEGNAYKKISEFGKVENLSEGSWNSVSFGMVFDEIPVVIHQVEYSAAFNYDDIPCATRIRNIDKEGFEIRAESWDDSSSCPATGVNAYWLAAEKGIHNVSNGGVPQRVIEVSNFTMSYSACGSGSPSDWTYSENQRLFDNSWTNQPLVLSSVQTANDLDVITYYQRGCTSSNSDTWNISCIEIGLNGLENDGATQPCTLHTSDETGGYIAWEMDSNWSSAESLDNRGVFENAKNSYWEAYWESTSIKGAGNDAYPMSAYSISTTNANREGVVFASGISIEGADGFIPVLRGDYTSNRIYELAVEDQYGDSDQNHASEAFNLLFFNTSSGFLYSEKSLANMTVISPEQDGLFSSSNVWFNVSLRLSGDSCSYSLNGGTNQTMTKINSTYFAYSDSISEGDSEVIFYCNSSYGEKYVSEQINFTVDTTVLAMNLISPTNSRYETDLIDINVSLNKKGDFCIYSLDGGNNNSITKINDTLFSETVRLTEDAHNLEIHCTDKAGDSVFDNVSFLVDIDTYRKISEFGIVRNLLEGSWTQVNFNFTFDDVPVVIHDVEYNYDYDDNPCSTRIRNVDREGFEMKAESWSPTSSCPSTGVDGHWIALEKGIHNISSNGVPIREIEVANFTMSSSACGSGANPTDWTYSANLRYFTNSWENQPMVFGAVQSTNDLDAITHYVKGCSLSTNTDTWNTSCVQIGLNGLENDGTYQPCTLHTYDEEGGYLAWEMDSNWSDAETLDNNGSLINSGSSVDWEAFWENDDVEGSQNDPYPMSSYYVDLYGDYDSGVILSSSVRIDGGNGMFPVGQFNANLDRVFLLGDEDEYGDSEQQHTPEPWEVLFFGSSSGFLYSDEILDVLTVISPVNGTDYGTNLIDFNLSSINSLSSCNYSLDGGANNSLNMINDNYFSYTYNGLSDGAHEVTFYCDDDYGGLYVTNATYFSVDTTPLTIDVLNPIDTQTYNSSFIDFEISLSKSASSCEYSLNGATNISLTKINSTYFNASETYLREGNYDLDIYCGDGVTILNSTSISFEVNVSAPEKVYRGSVTLLDGQSEVNVSLNVSDLSKAFLLFSKRSGTSTPAQVQVLGELKDNHINFKRYSSTGDVYLEWEVIQSSELYVQRGISSYISSISSISETINSVNLTETFALFSGRLNSGTTSENVQGFWEIQLSDSTNVALTRGTSGTLGEAHWQVIEWDGSQVQSGSTSLTGTSTSESLTNSVNLSNSFLILSQKLAGDTSIQDSFTRGVFDSESSLTIDRQANGGTLGVSWFVVENAKFNVQSGSISIDSSTPVNDSFVEVNLTRSFSWMSYRSIGTGTTYANGYDTWKLENSSTIQFQKGTNSNNQDIEWFVISLGAAPINFIKVISPLNQTYSTSTIDFNVSLYNTTSFCKYSLDEGINQTMNKINDTYFSYSQSSLSSNPHNVTFYCNDTNGVDYFSSKIYFLIDVDFPIVQLEFPINDSFRTTNDLVFSYNVTDDSISSCSLIIDDVIEMTDTSISTGINQTFDAYVQNGEHWWNVNCTDMGGLENSSEKRFINISGTEYHLWSNRWYESFNSNVVDATAQIKLNNTRDGVENNVAMNITSSSLANMVIAKSPYLGNMGAIIPGSTTVDFSAYMTVSSNNFGYITWKSYITNASGDFLICQAGDDSTGGIRMSSASGTWTDSCTSPSNDLILKKSDRVKLVMNVYNAQTSNLTVTHSWDNLRLSFMEFGSFDLIGVVSANLTSPLINQTLNSGDEFDISCEVNCSVGKCYGTNLYAQYLDSSNGWLDVSSSGDIILGSGESNPHNLGDLVGSITSNFTLKANLETDTQIRCSARGTYDSSNSSTVGVSVSEYPQIYFTGLTPGNGSNLLNNYFRINISINDSSLDEFIFNFNGENYTFLKDKLDYEYGGKSILDFINVSNLVYGNNLRVYPDSSLKLAWTFNNDSRFGEESSEIVDLAGQDDNGTITGAVLAAFGKYGSAINFTGNDYVRAPSFSGLNNKDKLTISAWVKQDSNSQGQYLLWADGNVLIEFGDSYTNPGASNLRLRWNLDGAWRNSHSVVGALDTGIWNNWIFVFDEGSTSIYKNGINIYNGTDVQTNISSSSPDYNVGLRAGAGGLNGSVDEFMVWDKVLSDEEILAIGSSDLEKDDSGFWSFALNVTTLPDGDYSYYGYAKNKKGNINMTGVRWVTVNASETTPPIVTIIAPLANQFYSLNGVDFNVSLDKSGDWCGYSLDGGANVTLTAMNSTYYFINSNIADGSHSVLFYCNSSFGIMGSSSSRIFTVDSTAPSLSFVSPTPVDGSTRTINDTSINITVEEDNLNKFYLGFENLNNTFYDGNLVLMMNLNNNSALNEDSSTVYDSSLYSNHGSFNGDVSWNDSGKYSSAVNFDGTNDWITVPDDSTLEGMTEFTFEAWVYDVAGDTQPRGIASKRIDSSSTSSFTIFLYSNRYVYFDIGSSSDRTNSGTAINANEWTHVVVTFNGSAPSDSRKKFYLDGELVATTPSTYTAIPENSADLTLGILNTNYGNSWQGMLDEIKIYNKTLEAREIVKHYQSNFHQIDSNSWNIFANITNLSDGTYGYSGYGEDISGYSSYISRSVIIAALAKPPRINLNLPLNDTLSLNSNVNFNFTVIDDYDLSLNCNLTLGDISDDEFTVSNNTLTNRLLTNVPDGVYGWNVTCQNSASGINNSETRLIEIAEPPSVFLNTSNLSWFNQDLDFTYTPWDNSNFSNCSLIIGGVFNQSNSTLVINGVVNQFSIEDFSDGVYYWTINCTDTYGLESSANEERIAYRDSIGPTINLSKPFNGEQIFSSSVQFNFTVFDNMAENMTCNLTVDNNVTNENFEVTNGSLNNITNTLSSGFHLWNVTCVDLAGTSSTSVTWNFTNYEAPSVSLDQPVNGTWFNYTNLILTYNVYDGDDNLKNCSLYKDGIFNKSNETAITNGAINNFSTNFEKGKHNWTVRCIDETSLIGITETREINIDLEIPQIIRYLPEHQSILNWNNVTFNWTAIDDYDGILNCTLIVDSFPEKNDLTVINNSQKIEYVMRNDGDYEWQVECVDEAGNANKTSIWNFTMNAPPRVTLSSPPNNNLTKNQLLNFSYTPEDAAGITKCELYLDNLLNDTDTDVENNKLNSFFVTGVSEGRHNWTVNCTDAEFNTYAPIPWNVSIDLSPPLIVLEAPQNQVNLYLGSGDVTFTWKAIDNLDTFIKCDLSVDGNIEKNDVWLSNNISNSEIVSGLGLGEHNWTVDCEDTLGNSNNSGMYYFNLTLVEFFVNSSKITFNVTNPIEGDLILVNSTIENTALADAENVLVRFYDGNPSTTGVQIGSDVVFDLNGSSVYYVNITFIGEIGLNEVFVEVDPLDAYSEGDENNNLGNKTDTIGSWQFVYGEINSDSEFNLGGDGGDLINWSADSFLSGNIFVTDSEASISWSEIISLGREVGGAESFDDFAEVDSALGMDVYDDSISDLYTNGTQVKNLSVFSIFNKEVSNVPIVVSIDSINFITGILWDSSDSSNSEYDLVDEEDLIFVTEINKDTVGSYGIVDYELRIPAKLREYDLTDSNSAVFYVELN